MLNGCKVRGCRVDSSSSLPGHAGVSAGTCSRQKSYSRGLVDRVVLAGDVVHREAAGERLLIGGLRLASGACGSPVTRLDSAPVTYSVCVSGSRSPSSVASTKTGATRTVSQAGRQAANPNRGHAIARRRRVDDDVAEEDVEAPRRDVRREHFLQRRQPDARFVAQAGNVAVARIEQRVGARRGRERIVARVVVSHPPAQLPIASGAAGALDPGILVGRHGLRRELSANPVGLLGHDDAQTGARGGERSRASAESAAGDHEIGPDFPRPRRLAGKLAGGHRRDGRELSEERAAVEERRSHMLLTKHTA